MIKTYDTDIIVIGGGPAGLSAAAEASSLGAKVMVFDTDLRLGGQLTKQTHKFFGSVEEFAGTRGFKIVNMLCDEIKNNEANVKVFLNSTVTGYYTDDGMFTAVTGEEEYFRIKAKKAIVAAGAQERLIPTPGNDLPGVYGAGAVQTLMNVYGVVPGKKVLMIGAGNIGLIVSYQLMQAGVTVSGIVEGMASVGGYWVHAAKVRRMGVPIFLNHTLKEIHGKDRVTGATIMEIDKNWQTTGNERTFDVDTVCMAVGLQPTTELMWQAECKMKYVPFLCGYVPMRNREMRTSNDKFFVAGDAAGIEEASAAMVEGRIAGLCAARDVGNEPEDFTNRLSGYWARLTNLRAGPVGEKIRLGLEQVMIGGAK